MNERPYWSGWPFTKLGERPESGSALRNYEIRERRYTLQQRVMDIIVKRAPALAYGDQNVAVNDTVIQEILNEIEEKQAGYALKHSRNFLVQGLDKGKRQGLWNINVPAPVSTVRRKPALFQPETFAHLPQLRRIQSALNNTLNDPQFYTAQEPYLTHLKAMKGLKNEELQKLIRAGQLLATAILYGGLLDTKAVYLLPTHINAFKLTENFLWIDLIDSVSSPLEAGEARSVDEKRKQFRKEQVLLKRWFPDAFTELLLLRWHHDELGDFPHIKSLSSQSDKYCNYLLRVFLTAAGVESNDICTASELVKYAATNCALEIPSFLLNYAQGKHPTRSLPAEAWRRLHSRRRIEDVTFELEKPALAVIPPDPGKVSEEFHCIEQYDQHRLYKAMIRQLSPGKRTKKVSHSASIQVIERFMHGHQGHIAAPLYRLCQWAIEMYRNGSYTKARLALSTIPKYLGQLQDLVNHLGNLDPMQRDADDLLEVYQLMIDQTKTAQGKFYKLGRIKEFHHFLVNEGYYESLDLDDLVHGRATGSKVDANYISETEYRQSLLELTRFDTVNPRLQKIRRVILMLGYRCGLRRAEAWKLRMCDVQWTHYPVLMVVATSHKSVKSGSAIRQLPLRALLPADELAEFRVWYELRRAEQGHSGFETDKTFLFCHEHSAHSLVDENQIFAALHCVLRTVSGDKSLRYHHLRHSFANNLLMHSMGLDILVLKSPDSYRIQNIGAEKESQDTLFALPLGSTSRKHLFQVSALLGHGGPDISLLHYIHLCDLFLMYSLNAAHIDALQVNTICVMANINRDTLNKTRQRNYPGLSSPEVARIKLRQRFLNQSTSDLPDKAAVFQDSLIAWPEEMVNSALVIQQQEPAIALLQQVIENYHPINKDADYWAAKTAFSADALERWIHAAQFLAQMKTGKNALRHHPPHRPQDKNKKKNLAEQHAITPPRCMPRPHSQKDIEDSRHALQGIQRLRRTNPDLACFGVGYYLRYNVASHSHLRMTSPEKAEKFAEFVQAIGFARSRIQCHLKPQARSAAINSDQQVMYWAKLLSIAPAQIKLTQPLRERGAENGTLSMTLSYRSAKGEILASYGFRYALYMMGVLMLASGEVILDEFC
jgi:site-specific recombinase XerD